jgi:flagellar basal-body rod modification protein FlgD
MSTTNPLNNVTVNTGYTVGTTVNTDGTTSNPSDPTSSADGLSQDNFLQLLVAELKYQDPSSPADPTAMMSQEAAFSQLSAIQAMTKQMTSLLNSSQSSQAAGMIGKNISAVNPNGGDPITGVVTGTKLGTDGPTLLIGNTEVALSSVTEVDAPTTNS